MSSHDYQEKLKHPKWQKKRLKILERASWKCQCCGDEDETLMVHHLVYGGGNPWEIEEDKLEALCESCHGFREEFNHLFGRSMVPTQLCWRFFHFYREIFDGSHPFSNFQDMAHCYETAANICHPTHKFKVSCEEIKPRNHIPTGIQESLGEPIKTPENSTLPSGITKENPIIQLPSTPDASIAS